MSRAKDRALKSAKEARGGGGFLPFRTDVLRSEALRNLSPYATKLLLDLASQWHLGRNGDASAAFENVMRKRGWRSKSTLHKSLKDCKRVASAVVDRAREIRLLSRQWSQSRNVPGQELVDAVDGIVADVREHVF